MAEVPLPTPTQVPVPSTDIRNAVFAGAKLDEEVTGIGEFYTDRLGVKRLTNTGRNNQFNSAQQDRESRFNTFIQNSGYDVIGDYTSGPLTLTEYNQLIRYNNELYKLTAATDIPFTTAGNTDDTWTSTDAVHFVSVGDATLRQNLGSDEEGMGGDLVQANQTYTISDILRRMRTLGDIGAGRPVWGYDTSNDEKIYNAQAGEGADDIMMNGGFFLARKFRGTSRFAVVSGIRGGRASVDDSGAFRAQVVSVSSSLGIANYGLHDGVSDYADALLPALESWETVSSATYTASTVTISPETYSETLKNILKGDVIRTRHSSRYWGTVQSVNQQTGVITVDMWALKDSPDLTPENDGSGFYLNFIDKVWADNKNVIVRPNSAGLYANVGEFGALVQKAGMGYVNGMDMVLLSGSTQDATAAYLARSGASGLAWLYGYNAQGNRFNYYSDEGSVTPYAGFMENSNAIVGMKFRNKNTYSIAWTNSSDLTAVNPSALTTIIGPAGHVFRRPERILTLSASGMLNQFYPTTYVTAAGVTITLPDKTQMPTSGYVFKVRLFLVGTYIFNTYQGQSTINGNPQLTVTTTTERQTIEFQFDGTYWQAFVR
ncbi:hypothetical protein Q6277_30350 [Klebsiella quasipneumoniae]|uniref:hypothetical protein n=1 Tax=Klebsiella quasipneumoniae TaxID=1463165 RepID=UPI0039C243B7